MARDLTPVHPELRQMAESFPRLPFNRWNIWFIQRLVRLQPKTRLPDDIHYEQIYIQDQDSKHKIRLCIYKPRAMVRPTPVMVWIHGGGMIIGRAEMSAAAVQSYVQELGIMVVSVDYRLAPNHPFPAPLDDCYAALKWVASHAEALGIDPNRIAIGGESAGAGLAASLVQIVNDHGEIHPTFQLLIYPMLDNTSALRTDVPHADLLTWTPQNNRFGWESYLHRDNGTANDLLPYAVPFQREDFTGFPPAWIGVGTLDLFYDEDVAYTQKLKNYGIDCELVTIPGAFHGFDQFDATIPVVQAFRESQVVTLRKRLFPENFSQ